MAESLTAEQIELRPFICPSRPSMPEDASPDFGYTRHTVSAIQIDHAEGRLQIHEISLALEAVHEDAVHAAVGADNMLVARSRRGMYLYGVHILDEPSHRVGPSPDGLLLIDSTQETARGKVLEATVGVWRVPAGETAKRGFAKAVFQKMLAGDQPLGCDLPEFSRSAVIRIPEPDTGTIPAQWVQAGLDAGGVARLSDLVDLSEGRLSSVDMQEMKPLPEEELTRFRVLEAYAPRDAIDAIQAFLADQCTSLQFERDAPAIRYEGHSPVSPSVLLEVVEGDDGSNRLVLSHQSLVEYLESEGKSPGVAASLTTQFMNKLSAHIRATHRMDGKDTNAWHEHVEGCNCPLAQGPDKPFQIGVMFGGIDTIDALSLVRFASLDTEAIRDIVSGEHAHLRFGASSVRLLRQLAARISDDMDQAVENE